MFLTSLLWHLEEFDESRFQLRDGITLRRFRPLPLVKGQKPFQFKKYRSQIAHDFKWPSKTTDASHFRCEFERNDWWSIWGTQKLDFMDLPGERVADAAIAVHPDYGSWSDHFLDHLQHDTVGRDVLAEYRRAIGEEAVDAHGAARAYRVVLARLIRAFKPFISPSVFLVDSSGQCADNVSVDELVEARRCGLDQDREFPPLPTEARLRLPEMTAEFERHYREYRATVVLPLFRDLVRASTLVILVDVPAMLLAGPRRFVDERQVVLDLVDAVQDEGFGARLLSLLGIGPALERVAFVAAKADLVAVEDLRNGRLSGLVRSMNARAAQHLPSSVAVKWFAASSLHSSSPGTKDTDENYLAVWQARETVENGLRLGAVGNLISTTVLSPIRWWVRPSRVRTSANVAPRSFRCRRCPRIGRLRGPKRSIATRGSGPGFQRTSWCRPGTAVSTPCSSSLRWDDGDACSRAFGRFVPWQSVERCFRSGSSCGFPGGWS